MEATTHDMQYICDETGLAEITIKTIKHQYDDVRQLLEYILVKTDLLYQIYSYVTLDIRKDNILAPSDPKEETRTAKIGKLNTTITTTWRETIPVLQDTSEEVADYYNDLFKQATLNRIRDILENIPK